MKKHDPAVMTLERTSIRRRLKALNTERDQETNTNHLATIRIEKEIFTLKQRMMVIDKSLSEESHKKLVGYCINPKCSEGIYVGQKVIKYGYLGLCCNYKCVIEVMTGS